MSKPDASEVQMMNERRFVSWCGQGLPEGWAKNMGLPVGDIVYPITDTASGDEIDGWPTPKQILCWCPSSEKQRQVVDMLNSAATAPPASEG